jgi:hypothetical protein
MEVFMDNFKRWIAGIISAASGAIGATLGAMVAAPETFNFNAGFKKICVVASFSAAVAVFNFLAKSPLPSSLSQSVSNLINKSS